MVQSARLLLRLTTLNVGKRSPMEAFHSASLRLGSVKLKNQCQGLTSWVFITALVILCAGIMGVYSASVYANENNTSQWQHAQLKDVGAAQFAQYVPYLTNKKVALVVNQSAVVPAKNQTDTRLPEHNAARSARLKKPAAHRHLVDALLAKGINIVRILSPEHGFRGDKGAGVVIDHEVDARTGLPIKSLYGKTKKPSRAMLEGIDLLVFDLQDVGVRFYTYLSTLHYVLEAAALHNIEVIVLDRPNPNGALTDGPTLSLAFQSFIGMHPIPVLHGMTLGELALMIKGEAWIDRAQDLRLTVIPVNNYHKQMRYSLPVAPSPNLPNDTAIALYPTLGFFEGTDVSIGRGTDTPFQLIGHPRVALGESTIMVTPNAAAPSPKHEGKKLQAQYLARDTMYGLSTGLSVETWVEAYQRFAEIDTPFFTRPAFFDKLAGSSLLRQQLSEGETAAAIRASWQADLKAFKQKRAPYLLYP